MPANADLAGSSIVSSIRNIHSPKLSQEQGLSFRIYSQKDVLIDTRTKIPRHRDLRYGMPLCPLGPAGFDERKKANHSY